MGVFSMDTVNIAEQLKELLKKDQFMSLKPLVDSINDDTSLLNDLAMDSIQILELIVNIEKEFSFTCKPYELNIDMFDRFGDLVLFIEKKFNNID
jgi:acyl carrier protein